jgi:hypothetical protein
VRIRVRGQVDLGARHVQEAERAPEHQLPRLLRVDDIVGDRGHFGGYGRLRPQGGEWIDTQHRLFLGKTSGATVVKCPSGTSARAGDEQERYKKQGKIVKL